MRALKQEEIHSVSAGTPAEVALNALHAIEPPLSWSSYMPVIILAALFAVSSFIANETLS